MEPVKELTVQGVCSSDSYVIPRYQRNYAWGQSEIEQMIQDIWDCSTGTRGLRGSYYIGSLVVSARNERGLYEIIDGQQRFTTLVVLLSALKHRFGCKVDFDTANLDFDNRKGSSFTLKSLFAGLQFDEMEPSLTEAYHVCCKAVSHIVSDRARFCKYLLGNVKILRIVVPPGTDLNHYFEIMNNRGEQLEKHEILKARLMGVLKDHKKKVTFGKIWDACSDMNRHVQLGFPLKERREIFGDDLNTLVDSFIKVQDCIPEKPAVGFPQLTLRELADDPHRSPSAPTKESETLHRFNSIINFSNFLVLALRLFYAADIAKGGKKDIPLDDKQLLEVFSFHNVNPETFAYHLLKTRYLFDRYVMKRESDETWSLVGVEPYREKYGYVNTFDDERSSHIVMILSMFHVSFPSMNYKHWLCGVMHFLLRNNKELDSARYLDFLERFNDRLFFGRFGAEPTEYFDIIFKNRKSLPAFDRGNLKQGTTIHNFIFNRLDYLIWKTVVCGGQAAKSGIYKELRNIKDFRFGFRSSVEHHYPRNPVAGPRLEASKKIPEGVDTFGNLCLISKSKNSKLSNLLPSGKRNHYAEWKIVESLKQQLMMAYGDDWGPQNVENIVEHERKMVALLVSKYSAK